MRNLFGWLIVSIVGCEASSQVEYDLSVEDQIVKISDGTQKGILLYECKNTDKILHTISRRAPQVESICLSHTDVSLAGLGTIAKMASLQVVDLDSQTGLTLEGIETIGRSKSIKKVFYWGSSELVRNKLSELGLLADECKGDSSLER
jgi:hypothetical protein